ncbi:hypothetical protein EV699_106142 [Plasticicumulans lactativorans]|uniref:Uncharacterized protein n=1 Tax=Plasticicumulans lactativorans TaxID=1133106 RepID=A0A4R2L4A0_9GAMM|nr:hypothetical protein [Plasticicumulans lactativorans]TCO82047.1 hypothetical protein EV699_106142 [Plasticicumulans lactativorans]
MVDKARFEIEIGADGSGAADALAAVRREFDKTARTLRQQLTRLDTFARLQQQTKDLACEYKDGSSPHMRGTGARRGHRR